MVFKKRNRLARFWFNDNIDGFSLAEIVGTCATMGAIFYAAYLLIS